MRFLIVLSMLCSLCVPCFAEGKASVIPLPTKAAVKTWQSLARNIQLTRTIIDTIAIKKLDVIDGQAHPAYVLSIDDSYNFQFDACNSEVKFTDRNSWTYMTKKEAQERSNRWLSREQVRVRCDNLRDDLLPQAKLFNFNLTSGRGSLSSIEGGQKIVRFKGLDEATLTYVIYKGNVVTDNHLIVTIQRSTGKISMVILLNHGETNYIIENSDVIENKDVNKKPSFIIETHDKWLAENQFILDESINGGTILLPGSKEEFDPYKVYNLKQDECAVVANGEPLLASGDIFFHPKLRQGNPLIYDGYFRSFLINVASKGNTLVLQGQLPAKGKKAELMLGSTSAIVDGKPITLSTAPQEIDGRLYLPYELLTLCNGVLTRWEPKKNTLWVDTRFLRRP